MKCLYRLSDFGYKKVKLEAATKQRCLENFLLQFPVEETVLFVDRVIPATEEFINFLEEVTNLQIIRIFAGSSAKSWRIVRDYALANFSDEEIVYFVEDDYIHCDGSRKALLEAMERADYVTLYDAPDKYVPAALGGNPYIPEDGADETKVYLTASRHWRVTNSTTMTFATRVRTLKEDKLIWDTYTNGTHPHDFQAFIQLRENGRSLLSPIPSLSTHSEPAWLAPLINWEQELSV